MYSKGSSYLKGILKHRPEDFIVEEIDLLGNAVDLDRDYSYADGNGDFLHLVMKKRGVDTISAVMQICSKLRVPDGRVNYAGVKDKDAVTAQRISIYRMGRDRVFDIRMKDIALFPTGRGKKIFLGDLRGNRFTICVRNIDLPREKIADHIERNRLRLSSGFPNFFGEQRFGSMRPVTCYVGLELIMGNIKGAVETYLSKVFPSENHEISKIRKIAVSDWKKALLLFPKSYLYERKILAYLIEHGGDYFGAFRGLPVGLQKMFVNAVQSQIFNEVLKMIIDDGFFEDDLMIPIVGYRYGSRINESAVDKYVERVLKKLKIKPEMFKMKDMAYLSSEGGYRRAFEMFNDFSVLSIEKDELLPGNKAVIRFSLPKGCYATVFISEFFDIKYPRL